MALVLDERGLLPPGVHDVTREEIGNLFGQAQHSQKRAELFSKLCEYLDQLREQLPVVSVVIDGSFVMGSVDEPKDIDLLLEMPPTWDVKAELDPIHYGLVWSWQTLQTYAVEVFAEPSGSRAMMAG